MPKVLLEHHSGSRAEIYLHGAHVTSWVPAGGREMLFLSREAMFRHGVAIRGGIPVVFPQFADAGPLPKHGWLRTSEWKLRAGSSADTAVFEIKEDAESMALWPHPYHVDLRVRLEEASLDLQLSVLNPGAETFEFTCALHTYLSVDAISAAVINGLSGVPYIDKVKGGVIGTDSDPLRIDSETDRVYMNAPPVINVSTSGKESSIKIESSGFRDAVVWNPWKAASRTLTDMARDEYLRMICIEAATVAVPAVLSPNELWTASQRLTFPGPNYF